VFRGKEGALSKGTMAGYGFHGVTAVLALWMAMQALAS
jgi:hypothetical protein